MRAWSMTTRPFSSCFISEIVRLHSLLCMPPRHRREGIRIKRSSAAQACTLYVP